MKPDPAQSVLFKEAGECRRHILGSDEVSDFIDADIVFIVPVVAAPAKTPVFLLLFPEVQKPLLYERNKRKCSPAGFGFRRILGHKNVLAVKIDGRYRVLDRDGVMLEIDGIPFQPNRLATAQAVERTEKNRDFQLGSLGDFKELVDFIGIVEAR